MPRRRRSECEDSCPILTKHCCDYENCKCRLLTEDHLLPLKKCSKKCLEYCCDFSSENDEDESNAGAIAGGVVGAIVVICIVAVLLFVFIRRKRKQKMKNGEEISKSDSAGEKTVHQNSTGDHAYVHVYNSIDETAFVIGENKGHSGTPGLGNQGRPPADRQCFPVSPPVHTYETVDKAGNRETSASSTYNHISSPRVETEPDKSVPGRLQNCDNPPDTSELPGGLQQKPNDNRPDQGITQNEPHSDDYDHVKTVQAHDGVRGGNDILENEDYSLLNDVPKSADKNTNEYYVLESDSVEDGTTLEREESSNTYNHLTPASDVSESRGEYTELDVTKSSDDNAYFILEK